MTVKVKALGAAAVALVLLGAACTADNGPSGSGTAAPGSTASGGAGATTGSALDGAATAPPADIQAVMDQERYVDSTWSLLVTDVETGEDIYSLNADQLRSPGRPASCSRSGWPSTRSAPTRARTTPVYRLGEVGADGTLTGDLVLVGGGDLTFGGAASTPTPSTSRTSTTTTPTASAPPISTRRIRWPALERPGPPGEGVGHHLGQRRRRGRRPPLRAATACRTATS